MTPSNSRLSKAFVFAICSHLLVLAALGFATKFDLTPKDDVFDVALMDAPADADVSEPEEEEEPDPPEPKEDDIVEERKEIPKPKPKPKNPDKPKGSIKKPGGTGSGLGNAPTPGNSSNGIAAPTVPPRIKRYTEPPYPSAVKNAGISGTVRLRVLIDRNGTPESVSVSSSSGNGQLDQSALNTAYKWRFSPGLDSYGKPVRCYAYIPIRFTLK